MKLIFSCLKSWGMVQGAVVAGEGHEPFPAQYEDMGSLHIRGGAG